MVFLNFVFINVIFAATAVTIAYLFALLKNYRFDIVDTFWGLLFITIATVSYSLSSLTTVQTIVYAMILVWGLRLSSHIYRRFARSKHIDPRYEELTKKWPKKYRKVQMYARVYLIQSILASLISLPILFIMFSAPHFGLTAKVGMVLWVIGLLVEIIADRQLSGFLRHVSNRGKLMTDGLWRYSRHPNYFGEILMWWAIAIMALSVPYGWVGFLGALTITFTICFVSGIPPAERQNSAKDGWSHYRKKTSVLVPWFNR